MEPDLPSDQSPPEAALEPPDAAPEPLDAAPEPPSAPAGDDPPPESPEPPGEDPAHPGAEPAPAGGGGVWVPPFQILRSRHDRKLGGVAGGLAAAAQLDPTLVRFAIVLGCLTGWGILAYLVAWAVIPEEDPARGRYLLAAPERTGRNLRIGLTVLAVLGVLHVVGSILGVVSSALIGLGLFPARIFGLSHRGFMPGEALLGLFLLIGGCLLLFRRHLPWAPAGDTGPGLGGWFSHPSGGWSPDPSGAGGRSGPAGAVGSEGPSGPAVGGESWGGPSPSSGSMALATVAPGSGGGGATAGGDAPPPPPPAAPGVGAEGAAAPRAARAAGRPLARR